MQDIDFDEIDRAVSSVTNNDAESTPAPTLPAAEAPLPSPTPTPTPTSPSPAARRSGGRFMDVVHPSSDMRPQSTSTTAARTEPEESPRTEVVERPEPTEPASGSAFHWPDPIDVAESTPAPEVVAEAPVAEPEPTVEAEVAPLESPFLTDAKVEKRPLGAFSTNDTEPGLQLLEDFPAPTTSEPEQPVEAIVEKVEPEEEADLEVSAEAQEVAEVPEAAPVVEDVPTGPTSITQQYKEQPSSTNEPSGSIYDTEAYHQPLTHTVKKRSGLLILVWIAALVLIGGGIGAAIYFVVLPML